MWIFRFKNLFDSLPVIAVIPAKAGIHAALFLPPPNGSPPSRGRQHGWAQP